MKKWMSVITLCLIFLSVNTFAQQSAGQSHKKNQPTQNEKSRNRSRHLNRSFFYPWISEPETDATILPEKYVVVPNRSDSTLTILATPSGEILKKITADDTGFEFEPIYASSLPKYKIIAVSDRLNSQLVFFDNRTFNPSLVAISL